MSKEFDLHTTGCKDTHSFGGSIGSSYGRLRFCQAGETADDAGFEHHEDVILIWVLLVHKEHRGCGHGTELIQEFLKLAAGWGYKYAIVSAWPLDERGLALHDDETPEFMARVERLKKFYRRSGFRSSIKAIDSWRLRKRLKR